MTTHQLRPRGRLAARRAVSLARSRSLVALAGLAALAASGCASGGAARPPGVEDPDRGSFPGFDTSLYPGDSTMRRWRTASPYRWVGYYLPAPCRRDTSWSGRRETLTAMGWGLAVLYVGQQAWQDASLNAARDTTVRDTTVRDTTAAAAPAAAPPRCSRALLSTSQGRAEAADAVQRMQVEGFPAGSVIFLDVERVDSITAPLRDYVRAWVGGVLADGRYRPGLYGHVRNALGLRAAAVEAYLALGRQGEPDFWVAAPTPAGDFPLEQSPTNSGVGFADVWQGALDRREIWGGVSLLVDANVSLRASPSAPPGAAAPATAGGRR